MCYDAVFNQISKFPIPYLFRTVLTKNNSNQKKVIILTKYNSNWLFCRSYHCSVENFTHMIKSFFKTALDSNIPILQLRI